MTGSITILGSGTGVPWRGRAGPGWVLQLDSPEADAVLVDPSAGSVQRMADCGIPLERLTHLFFSHYHPDHTGDLAPLLFALRNPRYQQRPRRLRLIGPRGLRNLLRDLAIVYGHWIDIGDRLEVTEMGGAEGTSFVTVGPLEVTAHPVIHTDSSVAYRFLARGGTTFAYSGDTDRCDGVVDAARNADLLLSECAFPEGQKHAGHLVPSEVGKIAQAAGVRRVVLLHLYPECHEQDLVGPCRQYFQGEVVIAEDRMVLSV
jgi:ribonuclease BN (tRNA processing enzyme)